MQIHLWAVSSLEARQDRLPDTDDNGAPDEPSEKVLLRFVAGEW
ncbi:MAG: hypothetical protein ACE5ID_11850 [Acidobacteriota bacterium]